MVTTLMNMRDLGSNPNQDNRLLHKHFLFFKIQLVLDFSAEENLKHMKHMYVYVYINVYIYIYKTKKKHIFNWFVVKIYQVDFKKLINIWKQ